MVLVLPHHLVLAARSQHLDRDELVVVNIGTAGALRDGLSGTFEIGTVLNHDLSAEPIRRLGLDPRERIVLDASLPTTLASGDLFVTEAADRGLWEEPDPEVVRAMQQVYLDIEGDMEDGE